MPFWQFQSVFPWSRADGTLTDQARLWLNALFKTVTTEGQGPVQLGGDIGGTPAVPLVIGLQGKPLAATLPANGQVLTWSTTNNDWEPKSGSTGTVTSVGLSMPAEFTVTNSPVVGAGTIAVAKATEPANTHYAGPASGVAAVPSFRALVSADLPAGTGTVTSVGLSAPAEFTVTGSPVVGAGALTLGKATQTANTHYAGPASGAAAVPTFRALVAADLPAQSQFSVNGTQIGLANVQPFMVNGHAI